MDADTTAARHDARWLRHAAAMVLKHRLDHRTWPASVENFQQDRGHEFPAIVRRAARTIARYARPMTPEQLAGLLEKWAGEAEGGTQ